MQMTITGDYRVRLVSDSENARANETPRRHVTMNNYFKVTIRIAYEFNSLIGTIVQVGDWLVADYS